MRSARAAAVTADHCLTPDEPETDTGNVSLYDDLWHREVAPNMNSRLLLTRLMYLAPNDRYDRLLRDLNRLDEDTLHKVNSGDKLAIARVLHLDDLPLLAEFARQRLGI
jgi:digeranylgeranylglycerophospholipid reductase